MNDKILEAVEEWAKARRELFALTPGTDLKENDAVYSKALYTLHCAEEALQASIDDNSKAFPLGLVITKMIHTYYPGIARADAEDTAVTISALCDNIAGILISVQLHHSEEVFLAVAQRVEDRIHETFQKISQSTYLHAVEKPDGPQGMN